MSKTKQLADGQKVIIRQVTAFGGGTAHKLQVEAPLPPNFGFGTQIEAQEIFAGYAPTGIATQLLNIFNKTTKTGFITRKMFTGADTPDLNFDLKFDAYDDAFKDVIIPVATLLSMGTAESIGAIPKVLRKAIAGALTWIETQGANLSNKTLGTNIDTNAKGFGVTAADINQYGRFIEGPPLVNIQFGNTFLATKLFLSSVRVNFTDVLDHNYLPMSASVSITATFQDPLYMGSVLDGFELAFESANGNKSIGGDLGLAKSKNNENKLTGRN